MVKLIHGERIGKLANLRVSSSAAIFERTREKVLLTRRADNGRWCLPGGIVDPGENVAEACIREVWEETGLQVVVRKLIGIYSDPNTVVEYPDGNRVQYVSFCFEAEVIGGKLNISKETMEYGYYTLNEIKEMDVMGDHIERIKDAFAREVATFIR